MAWSDYFIPDFDDADSPSYVGSPYLPVTNPKWRGTPGFVGDFNEEIVKEPFFDVSNPRHVICAMRTSFREMLYQYGKSIDENDDYDLFGAMTPVDPEHYILPDDTEPDVPNNTQIFDRGKYKGRLVIDILRSDPKYVEWARTKFLKFKA